MFFVCFSVCVSAYLYVSVWIHKVKETRSKISVVLQMSIFSGILLPLPPSQEGLTLSRCLSEGILDNKLRKQAGIKVFRATFFCGTDMDILFILLDGAFCSTDQIDLFFSSLLNAKNGTSYYLPGSICAWPRSCQCQPSPILTPSTVSALTHH